MKLTHELEVELLLVRPGIPEAMNADVYEEVKRWFDTCKSCAHFGLPPISEFGGLYPSCVEIVHGTLMVTFNKISDLTEDNR